MTALHMASKAGQLDRVRFLLESGADILAQDDDKQTPLSSAISGGHSDVALLLLEADTYGRTVNASNSKRMTPLHLAIESDCSLAVAEILLNKGADMYSRSGRKYFTRTLNRFHNWSKLTPLDMAIRHRKDELAHLLVDKMLAMPKELSALGPAWGEGRPLLVAVEARFWSMVYRLVEEGIETKNIMEVAIRVGAEPILDFLFEIGPEGWPSTIIDSYTKTFRFVCKQKNLEGLKMIISLLEKGKLHAEIPEIDEQHSLIYYVVSNGDGQHMTTRVPEMVSLLLNMGASAETPNRTYNETALSTTLYHFRGQTQGPELDVIKLLINATTAFTAADYTPYRGLYLHQVALPKPFATEAAGEITVMELLLSKGADVNSKNSKKNTALHLVAFRGPECKEELISFLLSKGADPNAENSRKETPLCVLVFQGGSLQSAIRLVQAGADPSARSINNRPLIHEAATAQRGDLVKFLLESGADEYERCEVCREFIGKVKWEGASTVKPAVPRSPSTSEDPAGNVTN